MGSSGMFRDKKGGILRWCTALWVAGFLVGSIQAAHAQTELEQARRALQGVEGFYLTVNLEGPGGLLAHDALAIDVLNDALTLQLETAGLTVLSDANIPASERVPYLHIHINLMEAGQGQIPFAVDVRFVQAVQLLRDPSLTTVAATWESSLVGLTYSNHLAIITEAATGLVDEFADDLRRANP